MNNSRSVERMEVRSDSLPQVRACPKQVQRFASLRSLCMLLRGYTYSLLGLAVALATAGATGFVLVSSIRHLLWLRMMPTKSGGFVELWLWAITVLSAGAAMVFWYRLVRAVVRWQQRQRSIDELLRPQLKDLSERLSVPGAISPLARWYVLQDGRSAAFTCGLLRPAVVLSTGLLQTLDEQALVAVMHHEAAHAKSYDPLQQSLLWVLRDALGPLGMDALYSRYLIRREILADEAALAAFGGDDAPLLSALLSTATGPGYPEVETWSAGLTGLVEARVEFLETGRAPQLFDTSMRNRLLTSALAVALTMIQALVIWCH
ncbi:M56 family metallopeptidase [Alicyclobacillus sp. ALC3]|uniref:M56 family metallopeptidase n=1 Tax=Alicyclobacillus sp. ALC3 TaxID=2796143 RepID=UPI002378DFAA|nr:M56 family metallopeptidase [Alicyclobacillus sp. ALC3]WDL99104.1 M56 family metallopeptidase [Alicyclobacillus sp. ALC3]